MSQNALCKSNKPMTLTSCRPWQEVCNSGFAWLKTPLGIWNGMHTLKMDWNIMAN